MKKRTILTLVLVVGMLVPATGAAMTAQTDGTPSAPPVGNDDGPNGAASTQTNYTRLYIDDRHQSLELKPGETESFTVTVENGEEEEVDLSPSVYVPPRGERPVEPEWVSIDDSDTTLDAGEEREFEITVSVPEDTELNRYGGMIALTDEMISYPGQPERPVHSVSLNVEVFREPTVQILSDTHAYTQVQAGETFTHEVVVENTGEEAVPVNPQLNTESRHSVVYRGPGSRETLDRSWLSFDAPSEIEPGETATIEVTVSPPADAERGDYRSQLDLGLKDPARPDRSSYWQEVGLHFQVWTQPEEPFETSFDVSDDTEDLTLELSADRNHRNTAGMDAPDFDVTFVSPNGTEVDAERVRVTNSGHVDLSGDRRPSASDDSTYAAGGEQQTFRYRVDEPEAGSWSVEITPENAMQFSYDIIRNEGN
jgi:hypothetical protein